MVLEKLGRSLDQAIRKIRRLPLVDKNAINALITDLQRSLLSADVKVELVFEMTENIKKEAMDTHLTKAKRKEYVITLVHNELIKTLGGKPAPIRIKPGKSNVILLVGIQGSGKTTTVAKLSKISVRETKKAINEGHDIIIVDTAGRHKEEKELMKEMSQIEQSLKPNEVILVIDGTLGQQAYSQAEEFAKTTKIGSIIVTKLDGTAKGGGALSACSATNQPIRFIGVGEKIDDFEEFDSTSFVGTLLGIPDLESLVKRVQEAEVEMDPEMAKRMMRGKFTLDDLYYQLKSIKKVGKMKQILAMVGGGNIPDALKDDAERNLERWEVLLNSMTAEEKENPKIIKKARKRRIAIGSGTNYSVINRMLDQYNQMKKFMKRFLQLQKKGKGFPGMGKIDPSFFSKLGKDFKF